MLHKSMLFRGCVSAIAQMRSLCWLKPPTGLSRKARYLRVSHAHHPKASSHATYVKLAEFVARLVVEQKAVDFEPSWNTDLKSQTFLALPFVRSAVLARRAPQSWAPNQKQRQQPLVNSKRQRLLFLQSTKSRCSVRCQKVSVLSLCET